MCAVIQHLFNLAGEYKTLASKALQAFAKTAAPVFLLLASPGPAAAGGAASDAQDESSLFSPVTYYFTNWFTRADQTRAEQPQWAPPIITASPCLQEVFRYDVTRQTLRNGQDLTSYGGGKGVELIIADRIQLNIGVPTWQTLNSSPAVSGWADEDFLIKYRLFAANEQQGNYVLSLYLGLTAPTGSEDLTSHHFTFTPAVAFGKGWGDFDFQSTVGVSIPDNGSAASGGGNPVFVNAVLQYRLARVFWPEVEANYTYWLNGENNFLSTKDGLNQLFITPGLVVGRFPIWRRTAVTFGLGCQFAVTDNALYHRNYVLSVRFRF